MALTYSQSSIGGEHLVFIFIGHSSRSVVRDEFKEREERSPAQRGGVKWGGGALGRVRRGCPRRVPGEDRVPAGA